MMKNLLMLWEVNKIMKLRISDEAENFIWKSKNPLKGGVIDNILSIKILIIKNIKILKQKDI
jgi:hypothetical protein